MTTPAGTEEVETTVSGVDRDGGVVPVPQAHASTMSVDEKTVVYDEDAHTMLVLNTSAGAVWSLCDGSRSVSAIVEELAGLHGTERDVIADDVWDTVEKLVVLGVLSISRSSP
jgi:hypothetical protein